MSNNNNGTGGKTTEFAVGWLKSRTTGEEYISAIPSKGDAAKGRPGYKVIIQTDDGQQQEVTSFAMFFNQNKKSERAPDCRFVFTTN